MHGKSENYATLFLPFLNLFLPSAVDAKMTKRKSVEAHSKGAVTDRDALDEIRDDTELFRDTVIVTNDDFRGAIFTRFFHSKIRKRSFDSGHFFSVCHFQSKDILFFYLWRLSFFCLIYFSSLYRFFFARSV